LKAGSFDKTARDNTDVFFSDYSDFVLSDFYKNNKSIITKYPPQKKVFEYVPPYKAYRIVIRPTSQNVMGNKIVYTVDSDKFTYDDDLQELYKLGGIASDDYFASRQSQTKQELTERKKISDTSLVSGYKKGYSRGYQQKEQEQEEEKEKEDNSPFNAFVKGFTAPISLVKEFL